ncbi:MAG: M28 family peptidase [Candidatus Aminicenantes bacterium]|nr:M28 family peptidase [Candidatus Aminicenantes bacterium]
MTIRKAAIFAIGLILFGGTGIAQMTPWLQWTFLPEDYMAEIIGEVSGEEAWNTIAATAGYNRNRPAKEYSGTFYEAQFIYEKLKEYGLPGAEIVRFPASDVWSCVEGENWEDKTWDGIRGELWEVEPGHRKLASYRDLTAMLLKGSASADVKAALVWVGQGSAEELGCADIKGMIVVTEGHPVEVHRRACMERGAAGVVSMYSERPYSDPLQIPFPWGSLRPTKDRPVKFAFCLPPREGQYLKKRLLSGEKIVVHAQVESKLMDFDVQDVVCHIPGTDPEAGEIIFSAHLFEWYTKQGANDNKSGSAAILEIARTLHTLIEEGRLPRAKRTIRFLWGPEFAGTARWVKANLNLMENTLCNINMDMVGEWLSKNKAFMCLFRTSYGNPHYINDVMENYFRFVGEGNRDRLHNLRSKNPWKYPQRIVAPSGSEDPFYYSIESMFKGSDNEVFNDWSVQVPGVFIIAWPDQWYHSSGDRPDKSDPTTLKRIATIGAAAAYTVAGADENMALKIAAETASNGTRRLGHQLARGLEDLNHADAAGFEEAYRIARVYVETAVANEKATLESVLELAADKRCVGDYVKKLQSSVADIGETLLSLLGNHMVEVARKLDTRPAKVRPSAQEKRAAGIIPKPTDMVKMNGYKGYNAFISRLPDSTLDRYPYSEISSTDELNLLINGRNSVLDIKNMLDAQYPKKSDLRHILNYLEILKHAGLITLF